MPVFLFWGVVGRPDAAAVLSTALKLGMGEVARPKEKNGQVSLSAATKT